MILVQVSLVAANATAAPADAAGEYSKHFGALRQRSIAIEQAMPAEQYAFRPHPDSMDFGVLISHIATSNFQFGAGLQDSDASTLPPPTEKDAVVTFLSDSFEYCSAAIPRLTSEQLNKAHNSPDGGLSGREILLAMYIHMAHHRGQAEIYLRDRGSRPPS